MPKLTRLVPENPFSLFNRHYLSWESPQVESCQDLVKGFPQHPPPKEFVRIVQEYSAYSTYPFLTIEDLMHSVLNFLSYRCSIPLSAWREKNVFITPGATEFLWNCPSVFLNSSTKEEYAVVPNPAYPVYLGAASFSRIRPVFLNYFYPSFNPDLESIPESIWKKVKLFFLCTPHNPSGKSFSLENWKQLFHYQERYGFIIISDECYLDLYIGDPPIGILEAAYLWLNFDLTGLLSVLTLSKRSNLAGARSAAVIGDSSLLDKFRSYREYQGGAVLGAIQKASVWAWDDLNHVEVNRIYYSTRFQLFLKSIAPLEMAQCGGIFFAWIKIPGRDLNFAKKLYERYGILVLPGSFISQNTHEGNPGLGFIRVALVEENLLNLKKAAQAIRELGCSFL